MNKWQAAATLRAAAAGAKDQAIKERAKGDIPLYHYWSGLACGKEEAAVLVERVEVER